MTQCFLHAPSLIFAETEVELRAPARASAPPRGQRAPAPPTTSKRLPDLTEERVDKIELR